LALLITIAAAFCCGRILVIAPPSTALSYIVRARHKVGIFRAFSGVGRPAGSFS
jgi:hypothetical protein